VLTGKQLVSYIGRKRSEGRPRFLNEITRGLTPIRESAGELPIEVEKDMWESVDVGGVVHISRTFQLRDARQLKMFLCDLVDTQESTGHEIQIRVEGVKVTVRSTTHDFGEPTERDREVAQEVDACFDEIMTVYK
jgi:pterin-4a-carbinolamine dehydratase